ncbi:MAG: hypothetical protein IJH84_24790 [Saccharopolyspora sp.]|uniref:hypothetical protein n=1 Tax=Saccharopolyspora sp. TaxID=33915 RepID=UPI0025E5B31C|nr:hypothetical protein [Saccharopolyspora sp.]MBQ6644226.1 hypothetical protein [Saccharopolyspora sp.]
MVTATPAADADPAPGFQFDPAALQARMDDCLEYAVDDSFELMGWVNVSTGESRHWRCSSLKHMMWDERPSGPHDPYVNVGDFMRCADRVVSYGFPRPATNPAYTRYILQYRGTERTGNVVVDPRTSDIASIYTSLENDWTECAYWVPASADGAPPRSEWQATYPTQHEASGSAATGPGTS